MGVIKQHSRSYRIFIVGGPGSGKTTVASQIATQLNLNHISPGTIVSNHIKEKTELGHRCSEYIKEGLLLPKDLIEEILKQALTNVDPEKGWIFDGFPRNNDDLSIQKKLKIKPTAIVQLYLSPDMTITRLIQRGREDHKTITKRMNVYWNETHPTITKLKNKPGFCGLDITNMNVDTIVAEVLKRIEFVHASYS